MKEISLPRNVRFMFGTSLPIITNLLSRSLLSPLKIPKAYVCTAPSASPCADAEGLLILIMPISTLGLFVTKHPPPSTRGERVHGDWVIFPSV